MGGLSVGGNPFGILQDFLAHIFYRYGLLVSKHPTPFIIFPLLSTFLLSFGILNVRVEVSKIKRNDILQNKNMFFPMFIPTFFKLLIF